jgi:hypothetical protein
MSQVSSRKLQVADQAKSMAAGMVEAFKLLASVFQLQANDLRPICGLKLFFRSFRKQRAVLVTLNTMISTLLLQPFKMSFTKLHG